MRLLTDAFGVFTAYIAYPMAERHEKRCIRPKLKILRAEAAKPFAMRKRQALERLVATLWHAGRSVPYYRDLFAARKFSPETVAQDIRYLSELPYLTKEIIREQGRRLISEDFDGAFLHMRKTGSSTGPAALIYYDQTSMDWTAAQNIQMLEWAGKHRWNREAHLSTRFLTAPSPAGVRHEAWKCFVLNRANIYTHSLGDNALADLWRDIVRAKARVVQGHASSLYALARYLERQGGIRRNVFDVFVSTGEMMTERQRRIIERVLRCRISDRYGAAEFGVMAQEKAGHGCWELLVADSMVWPECYAPDANGIGELVFTGLRNAAMPLIRYRMGDFGQLQETDAGWILQKIVGRVHDTVVIEGQSYPTHYIQDILDRCGDIQDFQILVDRNAKIKELRLVARQQDWVAISQALQESFPTVPLRRIKQEDLIFVGSRGKFRYLIRTTNENTDEIHQ